jgi:alpha-glucosidase
MIWDESRWDRDLLAFYRDIIGLRRRSSILQRGGFQVLAVEPDTLAYQREDGGGRIIVVAHRSVEPRPAGALPVAHGGAPEGTHFVEHFSGHEVIVHEGALLLPEHPQGATVWEETRDVRVV